MNPLEARRRLLGRNVYKRTTEGNPAIAQGSLARMYPGITMQGWTEQAQYEGKNLFDKTKIEDRIDTTHTQTDTGIEVSGLYYVTYRVSVAPNTDMRISYNKSGEGTNQVSVYGTDLSPDNLISRSYGTGMEFNTGKHTEILVLFYSSSGTENVSTYNNVMLNLGDTALPYEPYTGNKPSPSPEYPQPITSAGKYNEDTQKWGYEVKLTGKNLLPYGEGALEVGHPYEYIGRTYVLNEDGSITITTRDSSESSTGNVFIFGATDDRKHYKLPAGKYTVSTFNGNIPDMSIQLEDENGVNTRVVGVQKFELKEHEYIAYAWLFGAAGTECNGTIYPQLEYGGVSTSYEQYKLPQTVTLTSDLPLTKWDKLEKRNGQWGWVYKSAEIESYTDESVPGEYFSTTGQLSTGAQVWYETATVTFVPLTTAEQEQMNALHTFRPTTVLSNDCDCNMTLTYKTKKGMGG